MVRNILLMSVLVIPAILARDAYSGERTATDRLVKEERIYVPLRFLQYVNAHFEYTVVSVLL